MDHTVDACQDALCPESAHLRSPHPQPGSIANASRGVSTRPRSTILRRSEERDRPEIADEQRDLIFRRGLEHEHAYFETHPVEGRSTSTPPHRA